MDIAGFKRTVSNSLVVKFLSFLIAISFVVVMVRIYKAEKEKHHAQMNQLLREKDVLSSQIKKMNTSLEPLKNEVTLLRNVVLSQKKEKSKASPNRIEVTDEPVNISGANSRGQIALSPRSARTPSAKGSRQEQKNMISGIEKSLYNLKDYKKGLEEQNAVLKEKMEQVSRSLDAKEKELTSLREDNDSLKISLNQATKTQEQLRYDIDEHIKNITNLKVQLVQKAALEAQNKELQDKVSQLATTASLQERQLAQYKDEKASLEGELKENKDELEKRRVYTNSLTKKISELMDTIDNNENERIGLSREIEALEGSKKDFETELEDIKQEKAQSQMEASQLNAKIQELEKQLDALHTSSEGMKGTIKQLSDLLEKKESEINTTGNELPSLREKLEKVSREKDAVVSSLSEKEKAISEANVSLSQMEYQITSLQTELSLTKEEQKKALEQASKLKSVNAVLQKTLNNLSKEFQLQGETMDSEDDKAKADDRQKKVELDLKLENKE